MWTVLSRSTGRDFEIIFNQHFMKKTFLIGIALFALACNRHFQSNWVKQRAPEQFTARFETTRGNFDVEITRAHSPAAVDRLYQQVVHGFYDNSVFYRVIPGFVAQFGNSDTNRINQWSKFKIQDETVVKGNERGSLSFARRKRNPGFRSVF
jgi:hypothetical protein